MRQGTGEKKKALTLNFFSFKLSKENLAKIKQELKYNNLCI